MIIYAVIAIDIHCIFDFICNKYTALMKDIAQIFDSIYKIL